MREYNTLVCHDYWFDEIQALRKAIEILDGECGSCPEWDVAQFDFVSRTLYGHIMKSIDIMRDLMKPIKESDYDKLIAEFKEMAKNNTSKHTYKM